MTDNRLPDYLNHIQQAASDACGFIEGLSKTEFFYDKRTQQAVIMSLIIIGEAATKVMDSDPEFTEHTQKYPGGTCGACVTALPTVTSISTST